MSEPVSFAIRLRDARKRAGLSISDAASQYGISNECVWDLEEVDDELLIYSPAKVLRFANALGVSAATLCGVEGDFQPITPEALAQLITSHCKAMGISVEQFEEIAGWSIAEFFQHPERFLSDVSLDGIRDICAVLNLDWRGFISGLK